MGERTPAVTDLPPCRHMPMERRANDRSHPDVSSCTPTKSSRADGTASAYRRVMHARRSLARVLVCVCIIAGAHSEPARADQASAVLPSRAIAADECAMLVPDPHADLQRLREAEQWLAQYGDWKEWDAHWRNRLEPGWFGARARRQRPDPPEWLAQECPNVLPGTSVLAKACSALAEWNDDVATAEVRQQMMATRTQHEAPRHTSWWEHLHVDLLWPMTQWGGDVYGVVGTHATVEVAGRLEVFVAPGVILLNVPTGGDGRDWKLATDWGVAFRCFDFTMPVTNRRATLHLNLAKAVMLSNATGLFPRTINLAGFSVTMKKSVH